MRAVRESWLWLRNTNVFVVGEPEEHLRKNDLFVACVNVCDHYQHSVRVWANA